MSKTHNIAYSDDELALRVSAFLDTCTVDQLMNLGQSASALKRMIENQRIRLALTIHQGGRS